ncbi:cyclophilin-like protein [Nadsonia fulvescens var. elongata DSM 6958]|uniref:Peptidyl-prolyl cis-trans isomerase n=1 Tax=Nadsonia fulvescens var. elongata DSM 6958 TaxID=857566 RepID=A0A1E3PG72_9ASCO|nr:cyclophilin-like protein [Nadsonia fulvescens var. elongata DSM 6958]
MPTVTLHTTLGAITLELYDQHSVHGVETFLNQVKRGTYDNTIFHRIVPQFLIQGGDPTGTGKGGAITPLSPNSNTKGYYQINTDLKHSGAGIVSMAQSDTKNRINNTQFFITLAPSPWLDTKHHIIGRVAQGMRVVERLAHAGADVGILRAVENDDDDDDDIVT